MKLLWVEPACSKMGNRFHASKQSCLSTPANSVWPSFTGAQPVSTGNGLVTAAAREEAVSSALQFLRHIVQLS